MLDWSVDEDEHVRRLASEGSRPRLPRSFRLQAIVDDPDLTYLILINLAQDSRLNVRESVANHLNDVSKEHLEWLLDTLAKWPRDHPQPSWIAKRAQRTLIKAGHPRALSQVGASDKVSVDVLRFDVSPLSISLDDRLTLCVELQSQSDKSQQLVVDFRVYYFKKSGGTSPKVFKMKEVALEPDGYVNFTHRQIIKDFTTRTHYCGRHLVELMVNGKFLAQSNFELVE